ncbi:unnamed protein product [Nezara viridula]|uniref:Uncharacterized protein n=1 Tax=Nezara viridula TaxID=85310 RepID=A0A9P0HMQ8_NEZVI|nr:unnamed protein product [Nezara viridula]
MNDFKLLDFKFRYSAFWSSHLVFCSQTFKLSHVGNH